MLAGLRAHYPEHQHKEEEEDREEERQTTKHTRTPPPFHNPYHNKTRHALPPHTAITTHTPLRCTPQHGQCVDSRHHTPHATRHTPHALPSHTNHHSYPTMTQPCHNDTTLNQQCRDREHKRRRGGKKNRRDNARRARVTRRGGPNPNTGTTHTPHPAIQRDHHTNRRGTPRTRRGG